MLAEYYFEIKYIKSINNTRVNTLNRKSKLQSNKEVKGIVLRMDNDGKIRYNYL